MPSDSEDEENYCFYGKALEPYDEDAFPKKRPITVEDQIATDAQGRRRFHGAFTGGFSAGFFNTVGSLEGWTPAEFKSSRGEKADKKVQLPEDYMDEEDIGEFGIAPQVVRAKDEFANKKKRKKKVFADGPIPGEPVLETLLSSGNETVGYLLLRNMGLKNKNDDKDAGDTETAGVKVYGCEMPKIPEVRKPYEVPQYDIPEIYKEFLSKPKGNTFGLGYSGLDKSHVNLFQSTNLVVKERNNKKLSISGQAFGVGAFEDEDEDIYTKDNMNKYDFELTSESSNTKNTSNNAENTVFGLFKLAKEKLSLGEHFPPPTVPQSFSGKHNVRKSRFEPLAEEKSPVVQRKQIDANIRAKYLGEEVNENVTQSDQQHKTADKPPQEEKKNENSSNLLLDKFVSAGKPAESEENDTTKASSLGGFNLLLDKFVSGSQADSQNILEPVKHTENLHGTKEMRDAAAMKMFGPLTRVVFDWQPCSLLCKRFNVPEPHFGEDNRKSKKRTKHLIFEYQKDTEPESAYVPGLSTQKTETEEQKTEAVSVEEQNVVVKMEVVEEPSTSTADQMSAVAETSVDSKFERKRETTAVIDLTERVDVAKNTDLFKAIFLDSESENEEEKDEPEEEEEKSRSETLKNNVLSDSLLPKIEAKKDGILSNLDFSKFAPAPNKNITNNLETSASVGSSEDSSKVNEQVSDLSYGPRVPQMFVNKTANASFTVEESDDEWVEKDDRGKEKKSSHKHKKKNKKDKHEHKKKHKHDKKKK